MDDNCVLAYGKRSGGALLTRFGRSVRQLGVVLKRLQKITEKMTYAYQKHYCGYKMRKKIAHFH